MSYAKSVMAGLLWVGDCDKERQCFPKHCRKYKANEVAVVLKGEAREGAKREVTWHKCQAKMIFWLWFWRESLRVDEGKLNDRCVFLLQLREEGSALRCLRRNNLSFSLI